MSGYRPGGLFYQSGPDWNYLKYMETKSHFDGIELSVSSEIRKAVASNEFLAERNIEAVRAASAASTEAVEQQTIEIVDSLDRGFESLSVGLENIRQSADQIASICETGFSETCMYLGRIDDKIERLVQIAKTPDQTWAFEQFEIARNSFERKLFEEALDYINRAISGYRDRAGYRLEHRFHYLRGLIHLGNEQNFDPTIVDLSLAIEDFLLSSKYAEHVDSGAQVKALQMAGWASYCVGDNMGAEQHLRDALKIDKTDLHANYLLSKVLLNNNAPEQAEPYFLVALRGNLTYAIRAGADPDFLDHEKTLYVWIMSYKENLTNLCRQHIEPSVLDDMARSFPVLAKYNVEHDTNAIQKIEEGLALLDSAPLDVAQNIQSSIKILVESYRESVAKLRLMLEPKIEFLNIANLNRAGFVSDFQLNQATAGLIGAIAAFILGMFSNGFDILNGLAGAVAGAVLAATGASYLSRLVAPFVYVRESAKFKVSKLHEKNEMTHDLQLLGK